MNFLRILALVGFLAFFGAISAAVYFFGGFYNVAGTAAEPAIVKWAVASEN